MGKLTEIEQYFKFDKLNRFCQTIFCQNLNENNNLETRVQNIGKLK